MAWKHNTSQVTETQPHSSVYVESALPRLEIYHGRSWRYLLLSLPRSTLRLNLQQKEVLKIHNKEHYGDDGKLNFVSFSMVLLAIKVSSTWEIFFWFTHWVTCHWLKHVTDNYKSSTNFTAFSKKAVETSYLYFPFPVNHLSYPLEIQDIYFNKNMGGRVIVLPRHRIWHSLRVCL